MGAASRVIEVEQPATVADVRRRVDELGIEFLFAQFVHATPDVRDGCRLLDLNHPRCCAQSNSSFLTVTDRRLSPA